MHELKRIFRIFLGDVTGIQGKQLVVCEQSKWQSCKFIFGKPESSIAMKKVVIIGDSNQAFLLPLKIALLLGCPVFSGHEDKSNRGYCSSSSWPEVKKYQRCSTVECGYSLVVHGVLQGVVLGSILGVVLGVLLWMVLRVVLGWY